MAEIPSTMKALVQKEGGYSGRFEGPQIDDAHDWLELREIPVPQPGPGQVLLRVRRSSVNPSDLHFIKGEYGQPRIAGAPAGFEAVGDVLAEGEGVNGLAGQRVAFVGGSGAWAEYATADAATVIPLRPDVADSDGAALVVNPLTAMAMVGIAEDAGDAFVLSAATSQLGKLMIALGRDKGLKPIAVCRRADAVQELTDLGAEAVLVTSSPEFRENATSAMAQIKPRVFLDAVADDISAGLFEAMPAHSRWVVYGKLDPTPPRVGAIGQLIFMDKKIEGFWLTRWFMSAPKERQMAAVMEVQDRFATGKWHTDVETELSLDEALDGLAPALKGARGKVQIVMV